MVLALSVPLLSGIIRSAHMTLTSYTIRQRMPTKYDICHILKDSSLVVSNKRLRGSEQLQARKITDYKAGSGSGDEPIPFETREDADDRFGRDAHHIGHILAGQAYGETDALRLPEPSSLGKTGQQRGQPLIGPVQRKDLRLFLRFVQPVPQVTDHFHGGIRIPAQHVEVGFFPHPQDADFAHWLSGSWMVSAVEGRRIATKQVTRHEHFQHAFLPAWGGFKAFDRAFLDDVEVFGGVPFAEDVLPLAVTGFHHFAQDLLAILGAEDLEEGNLI